jgi:acyl carrier protein
MTERIIKIVSGTTHISPDALKKSLGVVGLWDSFSHIEIILIIEEEFHVSFSQDEIISAKSIEKIVEILKVKNVK